MTRLGTPDPIRPNSIVAAASEVLHDAIAELPTRHRRYVPCAEDPDRWFDGSAEDRAAAAELCAGCPLLEPCGRAAIKAGERFGVWAGRDFTRAFKGKRRRAADPERTVQP